MSDSKSRFHVSLRVKDINKSVEFYGRLFGVAPSKYYEDYAKFEVEDPGLVLSLEKKLDEHSHQLNHMGINLQGRNELIEWTSKVAERGLDFQHLDNVACCYSDQSKIFMNDPDGVLFEIYNVNKDLEPEAKAAQSTSAFYAMDTDQKSYDHILPSEFPKALPFKNNSLETIALRGSLNAPIENQNHFAILKECERVLMPGGVITLHMLVSDVEPTDGSPNLPEPASYVKRVPSEKHIWDILRESGFMGLQAERFSPHHVFEFKGSKFRELLITGFKTQVVTNGTYTCVYKGPFPSINLEDGFKFFRGERQTINADIFKIVSSSTYKTHFTVLNEDGTACGN
jgi:catechol 2,3-dioxygenase-like lactoylglutathione lyase family enzyme